MNNDRIGEFKYVDDEGDGIQVDLYADGSALFGTFGPDGQSVNTSTTVLSGALLDKLIAQLRLTRLVSRDAEYLK